GEPARVEVPVPAVSLVAGQRADLTLWFRTRADASWAPAGHLVAWEQLQIAAAAGVSRAPGPLPEVRHAFESLDPGIVVWRAPLDNETFGPAHGQRWERLGLRDAALHVRADTEVAADAGAAVVTHRVVVPAGLDDIPRVGVRLRLGPGVRSVEWLGR